MTATSILQPVDRLNRMDLLRLQPIDVNTVIYHANCQDGFFGAFAFCVLTHGTGQMHGVAAGDGHGLHALGLRDRKIAFIDVAFEYEALQQLEAAGNVYIVLDHHKTSYERLLGLVSNTHAFFDMEHSGAYLGWRFFHPDTQVPTIVRYVEDYDLWRFELVNSRIINAALETHWPFDFQYWLIYGLEESLLAELTRDGVKVLEVKRSLVRSFCKRAHGATLMVPRAVGDLPEVIAVNSSVLQSELGHQLLDSYPGFAVAAVYGYDGVRSGWTVSLRSRKGGVDVSKIAQQFGGGGHASAAGFFKAAIMPAFLIHHRVVEGSQ
jgi:hypothetical protein